MPSFRCEVEIVGLQPGVTPPEVLPRAEKLFAAHHRVEGRSVELVADRPQIWLRFLIPASHEEQEDQEAQAAVLRLIEDLAPVAQCGRWVLKRGPGNSWRYLASGRAGETPGGDDGPQ